MSPHLDDAVFSAGATLSRLARAGWDVRVVTVFTLSVPEPRGFALACQLDKGLGPDVDYLALRRAEDREAVARLGVRAAPVHLPFPEAPHRGYEEAAALFAGPRPGDAAIVAAVREALAPLVESARLVLAPAGLGGHVDHAQVVAALAPLADPVSWHDQPYALRHRGRLPAAGWEHTPEPADLARKLDAAAAYRSQLAFQFPGQDGGPAGEPAMRLALGGAAERFDRAVAPAAAGTAAAGAGG